jgi:interleukin enhancer-binding factor 2
MRGGYRNKNDNWSGRRNNYNNNRRNFRGNQKPFVPHVLFDFIQTEHAFPRVKPISETEDKSLNDALVKRNQDLTPPANEQTQLLNLITKIQAVLDNIVLAPGDFDACTIEEVRQVGSFKKGTMLMTNKLNADICVVLKTLPTREAVQRLATKVMEELKKTYTNPLELKNLQMNLTESGFEIVCGTLANVSAFDVAVQVLVTTNYYNLKRLEPELHLDFKICQLSLASVKHSKWFEEHAASSSTIKALVRILKDIKLRFDGLAPLNTWLIELLAHYAVTNIPKTRTEPLSLIVAFRRIFQLLSAGFFLPGSAGIIDPCEQSLTRVHTTMSLEQQDSVCFTAQTLLRVLAHGGFRQILGLEGNSSIATSPSVWAGVVIIPSSKAYEPIKDADLEAGGDKLEDEQLGEEGDEASFVPKMELN